MDLTTLARTAVELLLLAALAGVVLGGASWLLLRLRRLTPATASLLLLATLVAIVALPIVRGASVSYFAGALETGSVDGAPQVVRTTPGSLALDVADPVSSPGGPGEEERAASSPSAEAAAGARSPAAAPPSAPAPIRLPTLWLALIGGGWFLGALVALARLLHGHRALARVRRHSRSATDAERSLLERLRERTGVRRPVALLRSPELTIPMAAGLARPAIFLPDTLVDRLDEAELEQVLLHELAHLARRDDWTQLLQRALLALLHFHPAAIWLSRRLDLERELAADAWVVERQGGARRRYAASLVKVARLGLAPTMPAVEGSAALLRTRMERRIALLADGGRALSDRVSRPWLLAGALALLVVAAAALRLAPSVALAQADGGEPIGLESAARLGVRTVLDTAPHEINQVAFSPDGTLLAAAGLGREPFVWEVATGTALLRPERTQGGEIFGVAFSPTGDLLAVTAGDRLELYDTATMEPAGERFGLPAGESDTFIRVAFSPDGTVLAGGDLFGTITLWEVATRTLVGEPIEAGSYAVCALEFSPDGAHLATGTFAIGDGAVPGQIQLWDVATQRTLGSPLVQLERGNACGVAFSPDGALLVGGDEAGLVVWDARSLETVGGPLLGQDGSPTDLAFHRDGALLASVGADGTATLWDLATRTVMGEPLTDARAGGAVSGLASLAFSPDGRTLATGYQSGAVVLWGVASGSP